MIDQLIYQTFADAVEAQNDCHQEQGLCGRFNTFHVGLLSDIQAGNLNSDVFAAYEFNRKKNTTRGNGYQLPLLIMEPLYTTIEPDGDVSNLTVTQHVTLYAADSYQVGCCGAGNYCTERTKMQILYDLKMMALAIIREAISVLQGTHLGLNILGDITMREDLAFSFGNLGLGGVRIDFDVYYSDCVTDCGFTYEAEPDCIDDLGLLIDGVEIAAPICEDEALYQVSRMSDLEESLELVSLTHHGVEYFCPTPIPFTDLVAINAFLQSLAMNETLIAVSNGDGTVTMYLISQCCTTLNLSGLFIDGWNFIVNSLTENNVPVRYYQWLVGVTCGYIQGSIPLPEFECCRSFQVTAVPTGDDTNVVTDIIKWHVADNIPGVIGDTVQTAHYVAFSRELTFSNGCPSKTLYYLVTCGDDITFEPIEELPWQ